MKLYKSVVEGYHGAKIIHWNIAEAIDGIVSGGYLVKEGNYWVGYDGDDSIIPIRYNQKLKKGLIEAIIEYSAELSNGVIDDEKAKENSEMLIDAFSEFKLLELKHGVHIDYEVGQMIDIQYSNRNKPCSMYFHFRDIYEFPEESKVVKGLIEKVVYLSNYDFDIYVEDLWECDVAQYMKDELRGLGGNMEGDEHVECVVAVVSRGRKAIMVNPQGFDYARYVSVAV